MGEIHSPELDTLRVCDYLELSLPEVVDRLSRPSIDALLRGALRHALELDDAEVHVHVSPAELVVGGSARLHVYWRASTPSAPPTDGTATIVVLPVQTGHDAVTELLVEVEPDGATPERTAAVTGRCLAELVERLARD